LEKTDGLEKKFTIEIKGVTDTLITLISWRWSLTDNRKLVNMLLLENRQSCSAWERVC